MVDIDGLVAEMCKPQQETEGYRTEFDGQTGVIETPRMGQVESFDDILAEAGFDPERFEMSGHPTVKTWDAQTPDGVSRLYSYKLSVVPRSERVNVDDLVAVIREQAPTARPQAVGSALPAVIAVGDLQLGKGDGDGSEGIVRRFKQSIDRAVERIRIDTPNTALIAFLGDCIDGIVSQGGKVIGGADLTLTEQLRLLRHLFQYAIQEVTKLVPEVHVASVPGNHDETHRQPVEAPAHDSFAVDSLRAVEEAYHLAGRTDGLHFHYPEPSELTIAVTVAGHKFLLAHGHQWRTGKHFDWWKGQAFSRQTGHDAEYLLAGHRHHFEVDTESDRFFIQVPSMESRSDWWRNKTGQVGNPGAVLMSPGPHGQPSQLAVI